MDEEKIKKAEGSLARTFQEEGIACQKCHGFGRRVYSSTSTWHGGMGGQALTDDVCDRCWGTGREDRSGTNLRVIQDRIRNAQTFSGEKWFEKAAGISSAECQERREAFDEVALKLERARWSSLWPRLTAEYIAKTIRDMLNVTEDKG